MNKASLLAAAAPTKRQKTAERLKRFTEERNIERDGWSISEWTAKKGLSRNAFYRLPEDDRPVTITIGNKQLVTKRADAEWEQRMFDRAKSRRNSPEAA
jgi:hypothetical protein